ncbi:MAG: DegQ family serine endoprotease [Desulfobacterales bacterium]
MSFFENDQKKIIPKLYVFIVALFFAVTFTGITTANAKSVAPPMVPQSFTELAEEVSPAVVNIRTVKTIKGGGPVFRHFQRNPFGEQDPFRDFFDRFFGEEHQQEYKQRSLGSGFIIDKEGYIVTNNHVVQDADEIVVKLKNGKEFDAEIIGRDSNTDLALLKVKSPENFESVTLGNSDSLKVGQWVVAIGSPFGLEQTVTAGIVSAKGRVIGSGPYDDFIQTDASINPGNSGGPLTNMEGEVVGINTAIVASGQGIGFAIPINLAKGIIEQLKTTGEVTRGWLGVAIQDLSGEMVEYYNLKDNKGVLVAKVFENDPADKAGIKSQDIIVSINGKKIQNSRELTSYIAGLTVGEKTKVTVLRDGKERTFTVKIAKREDDKLASGSIWKNEQAGELGIQVSNINPEIADRFNLSDVEGIVVTSVENGSKGDQAGLQTGDIIKEVNHQRVKNVDDFKNIFQKIKEGESFSMFVHRVNAGFIVIRLIK